MLKKISRVKDKIVYGVPAAVTVFMMSESAFAQQKLGDIASNVKGQLGAVGDLVTVGSFIGGLVLAAAGLMKLKQAADTQGQQVKYGEGIWRLAVGSGLVAIPAVVKVGTATVGVTTVSGHNVGTF